MDPLTLPPLPGQQENPPHVEFELRSIEDRDASIQAGVKIMKDQEVMIIYPRGGKDTVEKVIPTAPEKGKMPNPEYQEFSARFGRQYQAWKEGLEIPVEGTDLRNFPLMTPAQIQNCRTYHIMTVEQLAEANEQTISNIGMGGRALKMSAQRWLEFGDNGGKQVSRIEELETKNQSLEDMVKQLTEQVAELKASTEDAPRKPGNRKKGK